LAQSRRLFGGPWGGISRKASQRRVAQALDIAVAFASGSHDASGDRFLNNSFRRDIAVKRLARGVERLAHNFRGGVIKYVARKERKNGRHPSSWTVASN
jgi:hypothetical protein